jgi:uncharacterized membrane protein HdeD (DUF308 family)
MIDLLKKNWWLLLVRGILAMVFGLAILALDPFVPVPLIREIPFALLALLFGLFALTCGALTALASIRSFGYVNWALLVDGTAIALSGAMVLVLPGLTLAEVVYMIACASFLAGISEIVIALTLRKQIQHEWLLMMAGLGSTLFGIYIGLAAEHNLILVLRATCVYALVSGAAITAFSIRLRTLSAPQHHTATA